MNSPFVSVCIPTYNNPDGLRNTLEMITHQSYKNLEIIISDNCSPDPKVQQIIQCYIDKDPRIIPYRQHVCTNVNDNYVFVLSKATGKYVMWAQDDDLWSNRFIENLVAGLEANPDCAVAICPFRHVASDGDVSGWYDMHGLSPYWAIGNGRLGVICMGIWRRDLISKYHAHLNINVIGGDHITAAHMLMVHNRVIVVDSERYEKGYKKDRFEWCFQKHDPLYSFRAWYNLIRILATSPHILLGRKLLLPILMATNFMRACAVTGVQVILLLPDNPVKRAIQSRFFGVR